MQPLADQFEELGGRFSAQAGQAGCQQGRTHIGVAHLRGPGGQAGQQASLLRRDAPKQEGGQHQRFEMALVPQQVRQVERVRRVLAGERPQLHFDLSEDDGRRAIGGQVGARRNVLDRAQGAVDVEVQHLVQVLEEFVGHEEEVGQTAGLFAQAGEVNGGHGTG